MPAISIGFLSLLLLLTLNAPVHANECRVLRHAIDVHSGAIDVFATYARSSDRPLEAIEAVRDADLAVIDALKAYETDANLIRILKAFAPVHQAAYEAHSIAANARAVALEKAFDVVAVSDEAVVAATLVVYLVADTQYELIFDAICR